jgi:hypothetical protein
LLDTPADGGFAMSKRLMVTLAIIAGIGVGTGSIVMGILLLTLGDYAGDHSAFVAGGSALLTSSIAALIAHLAGGFRELDQRDDGSN